MRKGRTINPCERGMNGKINTLAGGVDGWEGGIGWKRRMIREQTKGIPD